MIHDRIPLADEIIAAHRGMIGRDFAGYRNHVFRMINFCFAQGGLEEEKREKIIIAGSFHDLGIWPTNTLDYLPPSIELANEYLSRHGLDGWSGEISTMIEMHHRLRRCSADPLAEVFRRGDLVDLSLGFFTSGIAAEHVREVRKRFPNAGFHRKLLRIVARRAVQYPLDPLPIFKW